MIAIIYVLIIVFLIIDIIKISSFVEFILILVVYPIVFLILYLFNKLLYKRINKFWIIRRQYICQDVEPCLFIKNNLRNNFNKRNNKPCDRIVKDLIKSLEDNKINIFLKENKNKEFITTTNEKIYKVLKKQQVKGKIKIEVIENEKEKSQRFVRLILMGIKTIIINCFNQAFWKYINEKLLVGIYKIRIL